MPPAIAFGIHHDYLAGYDPAEHFTVGSINHSAISQLAWSVAGHTIDSNIDIPDDIKINFGIDTDAYLQWNNASSRLEIGNSTFYYSPSTDTLFAPTLEAVNTKITGVMTFDNTNVSLYSDFDGELVIGATVSVGIESPLLAFTGNMTLVDDKYISFGSSGFGTDASIAWNGTSNYLDIQSADTRFSGTIAIPATSDVNTGVIEQPAGQRFIHTYGTDNLFVGYQCGNFALTGTGNTGIGKLNFASCLGASNNTAVGKSALQALTTGNNNMAIGTFALLSCNTGADNLAIGYAALNDLQDGSENVALGTQAGQTLTARFNVYIGASAGRLNEAARYTVGIGYEACRGLAADGYGNIGIGSKALYSVAGTNSNIGSYNTVMGYEAGYSLTTGNGNIFLGKFAGYTQTINSNLFIVDNVKRANPATDASNAILYGVMDATRTSQTLAINAHATTITMNGAYLGLYGTGNYGFSNSTLFEDLTGTGQYNTVFGNESGKNLTDGTYNVAIGHNALLNSTTGSFNVAIGPNAGAGSGATKDYSYNLCIGSLSGFSLDTGDYNVFLGMYSGYWGTSASNNFGLGNRALNGSGAVTKSFSNNIGIGDYAGYKVDTATYNTFIGVRSGYSADDDNYCIFIGPYSGYNQDGTDGLFIVDGGDQDGTARASAAAEATNSILYGEMKATPDTQTLRTNCSIYIREGQDNGDIAGYGQLYCKDNAGTTELWFVNDAGTETKIA